jgi:hypothetical protein
MKQTFKINDKPNIYQHFERKDDLIIWVFRYTAKDKTVAACCSPEFKELVKLTNVLNDGKYDFKK